MRGVTGIKGSTFGRHYREMPPTCQQELEPVGFKLQRNARLVSPCCVDAPPRQEIIMVLLTYGLALEHEIYALPEAVGSRGVVAQHVALDENGWGAGDAGGRTFLHV